MTVRGRLENSVTGIEMDRIDWPMHEDVSKFRCVRSTELATPLAKFRTGIFLKSGQALLDGGIADQWSVHKGSFGGIYWVIKAVLHGMHVGDEPANNFNLDFSNLETVF